MRENSGCLLHFACCILRVAFCIFLPVSAGASDDFWKWWGDGKAEVSTYQTTVPRYGELRNGYAVLIFVTEDISRTTRIKVESEAIPPQDRVPVVKLNRVIRFTTGIYDYSVLTSVFSSVNPEFGRPSFEPMKISFSAQEWCGHVFESLILGRDTVERTRHSYFQGEGDQRQHLTLPKNPAFEDNLLIWIRELRGEVVPTGVRRDLQIFPDLWRVRATHQNGAFKPGRILKEEGETLKMMEIASPTWRWTWQVGDRTETFWVEKPYPHRILRWTSSDGSRGELKETLRVPYWQLHGNDDLRYREELGIPP